MEQGSKHFTELPQGFLREKECKSKKEIKMKDATMQYHRIQNPSEFKDCNKVVLHFLR